MENILVSNERQNLRSEKCNSDSFSRFGDDLSEWLLTFLPLKQKFRFESICKQWKNLIFNKVFILNINEVENDIKFFNNIENYKKINKMIFEIVVKKCVFIKHIKIIANCYLENGRIFDLMANYCRYLEVFEYCFNVYYNKQNFYYKFNEFGDKCGLKLKFLNIDCNKISENSMKELLEKTPNVEKVYFKNVIPFIELNDEKILKNLCEVKCFDLNNSNVNEFTIFADKYHNKIEKLSIETYDSIIYNVLTQLSRFENLKVLHIFAIFGTNDVFIDETLELIAQKCLHLKELKFNLINIVEMETFKKEIFRCFSHFKSLNTLFIKIDDKQHNNFGQLKHLSNITNLSKLTLFSCELSDEDFENIDKYLPHLSSICLSDIEMISDNTLEYLSKLPNLSSLELINICITFNGIQKLAENTFKLKAIKICYINSEFEEKFINCLINWSKRRPKVMHKFKSCYDLSGFKKWPKIKSNFELPKNLNIDFKRYYQ